MDVLSNSAAQLSRGPVRVVIFGNPGKRWRTALSPNAPVWAKTPCVREVVLLDDAPEARMPDPRSPGLDTVIVPLLESHSRTCPQGARSLRPDELAITTFGHKARFARYLRRNGLSGLSPATWSDEAEAQFPCVLKSVKLSSGQGVAIARSPEHLRELLDREPWKGRGFVLQALVGGTREYVTHCVCRAGRILWSCSFAYDLDASDLVRTQHNIRTIRPGEPPEGILAQISSLLEPIGYTGPCNLDYKITEAGDIAVFEINPRLGGSLMSPEHVDQLAGALACIIENAR